MSMMISIADHTIDPRSIVTDDGTTYMLAVDRRSGERALGVSGSQEGFSGRLDAASGVLLCPLSAANAAVLRSRLTWLVPVPLGLHASFGFGDRIGLATPGHVEAVRESGIAPIFAQQSVRENTRIGRTPRQVLDDATWGVFQAGWRDHWGADADHVKQVDDLAAFVEAGYTFYTIDPSDHVDNAAQTDTAATLSAKMGDLPWDVLATSYADLARAYLTQPFRLETLTLAFDEAILQRAAAKYGRALAHAAVIARELAARLPGKPFDLELSVDETDTPTSLHEHFFIANELQRLNIPIVSLAPRFIGKFQKGVDYIGDIAAFEQSVAQHAAIMRHFGSYKLSIHTGSDKFSLYPSIARHTAGRVHVKTAGTSYLEALRVLAVHDPAFFRAILDFSRSHFEKDRKTYFLDCRLENVPAAAALTDADLPELFEQFDARQVLHVTFGSVLDHEGVRLKAFLRAHTAEYEMALQRHFGRHIAPFATAGIATGETS